MTATPTSAGQRSATRIVFPEPARVQLEEVIVDLRDLGPREVVVRARRSVISPGTELAPYRGDSLVGLLPPAQRPHQPFHPGYAMAGTVLAAGSDRGFAAGTSVLSQRFLSLRSGWEWHVPLYGEERSVAGCTRRVPERLADGSVATGRLVSGTITPDVAHAAYGVLDSEHERHLTFLFDWRRRSSPSSRCAGNRPRLSTTTVPPQASDAGLSPRASTSRKDEQ